MYVLWLETSELYWFKIKPHKIYDVLYPIDHTESTHRV